VWAAPAWGAFPEELFPRAVRPGGRTLETPIGTHDGHVYIPEYIVLTMRAAAAGSSLRHRDAQF